MIYKGSAERRIRMFNAFHLPKYYTSIIAIEKALLSRTVL